MVTLRGIDDRRLPPRAWLHERVGVLLRKLRLRCDPVPVEVTYPYTAQMLRARSSGKAESTLRVDPDYVFATYEERRALYTDFLTGFLVPRTTIWSGDHLLIEVNSFGCRGPEIESGLPVIAFVGDSTTLGVMGTAGGLVGDSWPAHLDLPGYAVLNAGVEGLQLGLAGQRCELLCRRAPLVCAVYYVGWHNLIYTERTPEHWEACLQGFLSDDHRTVLCTLPSSLLPEMRRRGIDPLVNERPEADLDDDYFHFWRGMESDEWLHPLIAAHGRYNAHVTDFCRRTGTPLIDLAEFMRPRSYEEAPLDFFDVCHFRPRAYPKVAAFIAGELQKILPAAPPSVADWRAPAREPVPVATEDLRQNIYPLW